MTRNAVIVQLLTQVCR